MSNLILLAIIVFLLLINVILAVIHLRLRSRYNKDIRDAFIAGRVEEGEKIFGVIGSQLGYENAQDFLNDLSRSSKV